MSVVSLPLLRGFARDDVAVWRDDGVALRGITAGNFCGAVERLARKLPISRHAINYCEDPLAFLVGSAAALVAGQTLILPQSRAEQTATELLGRYADAFCLVGVQDPAGAAERARFVVADADLHAEVASWPPPAIVASHIAAILFTSGTTGVPEAQPKTWASLVAGARAFAGTFGAPARDEAIIGTVAPQHMFGFETTVVAAWQCGGPVIAARPMFPADLHALLARAATAGVGGAWLMTTPLQLRVFRAGMTSATGLRRIIVSTMPLAPELAQSVERGWSVPVEEVYGCTEGGLLAARRTALDAAFAPASGLTFAIGDEGVTEVSGGHLAAPIRLNDRLRWRDDSDANEPPGSRQARVAHDAPPNPRRFELIGRDADMVKIAGKRTTLVALTRQLLAIPGVDDGVFFLPSPDAERTAAVAVAARHTLASLRRGLAQRIDGAFMPRPLVLAKALPRNAQGKLPLAALRTLAGIASPVPGHAHGSHIRAHSASHQTVPDVHEDACTFAADHPALPGHFPGRPVVPGVVLLDRVDALLRRRGLRIAECIRVKFLEPVAPLEPLALRVEVDANLAARFTIHHADRCAVSGSLSLRRCGPICDADARS